jgi:hypothetical protein
MSDAEAGRRNPPGDSPGPRGDRRLLGLVVIVISAFGVLFFSALALFSANPCGAFGDACDEVGGTGQGFGWFVLLLVTCLVGVVVGIAMLVSKRPD